MPKHLHHRFSNDDVKRILTDYTQRLLTLEQTLAVLGVKRRQFFKLLHRFKFNRQSFSIQPDPRKPHRKIDAVSEEKIVDELKADSKLVEDPQTSVRFYNYSFIQEILKEKHKVVVSLPTIIARAKKMDFIKNVNLGHLMTTKF